MIHVSDSWLSSTIKEIMKNGLIMENAGASFAICFYNSISRFAVPCFIMLSGAFILDNNQNMEYKKFYKKSFEKICVPAIIFSFIYILYRIPECLAGGGYSLLKDIVRGAPMYHMWYLSMLIGIYVMVPIILRFKNSISEKTFYKVSFIFLILASVSRWTIDKVVLAWNVGQSFLYLGYFMTGYSIRKIN